MGMGVMMNVCLSSVEMGRFKITPDMLKSVMTQTLLLVIDVAKSVN